MEESIEKHLLIDNISILRAANQESRGLSLLPLDNSDLEKLSVADLQRIEKRLMDVSRFQGGLH